MPGSCNNSSNKWPTKRTRLNEILSWRLLQKNPSGALIWAIFGAAVIMDGFYFVHFLRRKEYQVDHSRRMWNERVEMLENPVRMKLYYPSEESVPKISQELIDVYKKMQDEEVSRCKRIQECIDTIDVKKQSNI